MEQFSEDFSDIIAESASLMIGNKQKRLSILHICYGFFSNSKINKIASKHIPNIKKFIEEIKTIATDYQSHGKNEPDLDDAAKEILKMCVININNIDGKKKITPFDFMDAVLMEKSNKTLFDSYNFNQETLYKIRELYKNAQLKASLKPKQNLSFNKEEKLVDKHAVSNFITDITEKVKKKQPLILDFDNKINEIINILLRKEKSNPLIVGKPGVGKSTIVEGLALAILENKVPENLKNKKIIEINLTTLISGTNFRGDFEKRFENIMEYLKNDPNIIVFIDEIHCINGLGSTGSSKNELDFSNMIKPYLSSGEISCIGATTYEEYKNSIEKDKALDRRFKIVYLKEPSVEQTKIIVKHKKTSYETFHKIKITDPSIDVIVEMADRFISKGTFPDKAFDILDMCLAKAQMEKTKKIGDKLIFEVVSDITGIKKEQIEGFDKAVLNLDSILKQKIFGQDKAIKEISEKILVAKSGLTNPLKPLASFLLIGTTGVGKTEVVNEISKQMNMNFIRFDMSEFAEKGSASKLIGTSAGFIGYEEGGKLTEYVYHNPHTVILFDEIEKADSSIFNLFLQMLDYGKLTDGSGKEVDFRNTLIFMTSNAGAEELSSKNIGFIDNQNNDNFEKAINKIFAAEFRNRISKIITFEKLKIDSMKLLVNKSLENLKMKVIAKKIEIEFTEEVKANIIKNGFNEKMGARPLERYIEDTLAFLIAKNILSNFFKEKNQYIVDYVDNDFILKIKT